MLNAEKTAYERKTVTQERETKHGPKQTHRLLGPDKTQRTTIQTKAVGRNQDKQKQLSSTNRHRIRRIVHRPRNSKPDKDRN